MTDDEEQRLQTDMLRGIADELEELNAHVRAYLQVIAINLLAGPCGPGEKGRSDRDEAAIGLLEHVKRYREET
jgi:hypothetical protein